MDSHSDAVGAIPYLRKAIKNTDPYAEMYSAKEKSSPVDAYYYLGKAFHFDAQLDSAEIYYQMYIDESLPEMDLVAFARLGMKQCRVARREINNPRSTKVINVGEVINNEFPDYAPVVSLDGSALYYTARRPWEDNSTEIFKDPKFNHFPEDIYCSYIDFDGSWIDPFRLEFCEGVRNEATTSVSADERRIYVYQDDSTGNGDIFYSDFKTNRFGDIEFLDYKNVNTPFWEPHAMVSTDGLNLYFSSNRPGGFGGRDLYRSVKLPDNSWSEPINLGPMVNTPYDEDSPFLAIDNKTLYFSSNGPLSMGEFDIFVSRKDEDGNWSSPINLGYPLNTTADDIYYTTTIDGLRGFLSSDRKNGYGEKDIYEILNDNIILNQVAVLKGHFLTENDMPLPEDVALDIKCKDCYDQSVRTIYPRLRDGAYFTSLEPCHEYDLRYHYKDGTETIHTETIKTSCTAAYDEIIRDVLLRIEPDGSIFLVDRPIALKVKVKTENGDPVPENIVFDLSCLDCEDTSPKRIDKISAADFIQPLDSCHKYLLVGHYEGEMTEIHRETFETPCKDATDVYKEVILVKPISPDDKGILDGTIVTDDGRPIPEAIIVELVCMDCSDKNPVRLDWNLEEAKDEDQKGKFYSRLDSCHNYILTARYEGETETIYKDIFGTNCGKPMETVYKKIVIISPVEVIDASARLSGIVKTKNGDPLPEDMIVELTCLDCDDRTTKVVATSPILENTISTDFSYLLQPCHKYKLTAYYDAHTIEGYNENFNTHCNGGHEDVYREIIVDMLSVVVVDTMDVINFNNPKYKHYFEYNKNKINPKRGKFKEFVEEIDAQMMKGRPNMSITVYASASHVPTDEHKTNEILTRLRAENIKYDLVTYFQENTDYSHKLTINIVEAVVAGPEYKKDWRNKKKYRPHQWIRVDTE